MYLEFLFRLAHSRRRVERTYWSGVSLYSFTTCSKEVTVGTTGPIGSGLPQFGLPRRFAISCLSFSLLFQPLTAGIESIGSTLPTPFGWLRLLSIPSIHSTRFRHQNQRPDALP